MELSALENLGLTRKEAELYVEMVRLGESPVADLIKVTRSHPQVVYRSLAALVDKGLAVSTVQRRRKYIRAEDPRVLQMLQEKQDRQLSGLIPELLSLQTPSKEALIRVARGNEAVRDLRIRAYGSMSAGETYYIFAASADRFYEVMEGHYLEIERIRVRRGVRKKLVAFESRRTELLRREVLKDLSEYRFLQTEFPVPSSNNIFGDTVAIVIWSEVPVVITIVNEEIAASYRSYFELLWQDGKL